METYMQFYNTKKIVDGVGQDYSLQENSRFIADVKKATSISIVSAFYNIKYFEKLADYTDKVKIEVFIPAEKSITKLVKQKSALSNFINKNPNFQFRLIDSGYLLHTKLYVIKQDDTLIVWIGSSNASTNSIERCEELMLRVLLDELPAQRTGYIVNYIDELKKISFEFQERSINLTTSSLRHFFSQGHLYAKTSETFNPSIEIDFGEYHDQVMQALRANIEANSLTGLFIKTTNRISILELLKSSFPELSDIEATTGGGEGIKKFGLFTNTLATKLA
jgi:HKD family nuclease